MAYEGPPELRGEVAAAAERLRIDAAAAEVLQAFASDGVQARLLKGPSLTDWLYGSREDAPPYLDSDLLVRPGDERAAGQTLGRLGFELEFDDTALPDWWREHGTEWWRARDGVRVDLHRHIVGIGVDPRTAWDALAHPTATVSVAGYDAPTLAPAARLMHVALHAAQHGAVFNQGVGHLERALATFDDDQWRSAAVLAGRLEATGALAAGLRITQEGRRLADRLGLPEGGSVDVTLRARTAPPVALGFDQLARAGSWRARVTIVRHKAVPPPSFVRAWSPLARRGRLGLAVAYAWRPLWLLVHAPMGFRAWRAARRRRGT